MDAEEYKAIVEFVEKKEKPAWYFEGRPKQSFGNWKRTVEGKYELFDTRLFRITSREQSPEVCGTETEVGRQKWLLLVLREGPEFQEVLQRFHNQGGHCGQWATSSRVGGADCCKVFSFFLASS